MFEGIPHPFDKMKRQVMPAALANLKVRPGRKSCRLGDLAESIGWKHNELLARLENKRKTKSEAFYQTKKVPLSILDTRSPYTHVLSLYVYTSQSCVRGGFVSVLWCLW